MPIYYTFYWPYAEDEQIEHFEYIMCLGHALTLNDENSYYFGNVERFIDPSDNSVSMIFYFCRDSYHTHPGQPSCSRYVMCFPMDTFDTDVPVLI